MKTVFINCSPKKNMSASGFLVQMTSLFTTGKKIKENIRTRKDYDRVLETIRDADNIVFAMPLYVDGIPSHILPFLKLVEKEEMKANVYVLANNGFIEGRQNEPLMQVMENFCDRANLNWCGGLGIGGGVMMNVMRIMIVVYFGLFILNCILNPGNITPLVKDLIEEILVVLLLGCGIITFDIWMASCISKGKNYGKHYTRIMLPSFVFILCADIFFTIISLFHGGIFRGWFSKKQPSTN